MMKNEITEEKDLRLAPEQSAPSEDGSVPASEKHKAPKRVMEIAGERGKNFKVFRMDDGTEQAVFSPSPIHVFDEKTKSFEDVEPTIVEEDDGRHFTCGRNAFVARFSREEDSDELFSVEEGAHKVTVFARKNKKNRNKGVAPVLRKRNGTSRATDVLSFAGVEPDTDYEYSVEGSGVKENIVVAKPCAVCRYRFLLRCENVSATLDEEKKRISFTDSETGEEVFFIPAPFMTDAAGAFSDAVSYEMRADRTGAFFLTVSADAEWMNAAERVFPVTVDPQIRISGSGSMTTYSWNGGVLSYGSDHTVGTVAKPVVIVSDPDECLCQPGRVTAEMEAAQEVTVDSLENGGVIDRAGGASWYKFTAIPTLSALDADATAAYYTICTQGPLDTVGELYDSEGTMIAKNDDGNGKNFRMRALVTFGQVYYLKITAWNSGTGVFDVIVSTGDSGLLPDPVTYYPNRMYLSFTMPTLPRNPRIKKAELQIFQKSSVSESSPLPLLGLYRVTDYLSTGNCNPAETGGLIDYARMQTGHYQNGEEVSYTFDITTLADQTNRGEITNLRLVLRLMNESIEAQNNIVLYGASDSGYAPKIVLTYESSYGVDTAHRTHTHPLGRFGEGAVDLQCGNLMFDSKDFAWSGNRMPVTIRHLYNSALAEYAYTNNAQIKLQTADFSDMKVGLGFRLNLMQSMTAAAFEYDGVTLAGYVFLDENGTEKYFRESGTEVPASGDTPSYHLYEEVTDSEMVYDPVKRTLKQGTNTCEFDEAGRLIAVVGPEITFKGNVSTPNRITITYTANRITSVTDGAEREFGFSYNANGQLTSIVAPDLTAVTYTYENDLLTRVDYPDDRAAVIAYTSGKPASVTLKDAENAVVYKVAYTFGGNRLSSVTEYAADGTVGSKAEYSYSAASAKTQVKTTEPKDTAAGDSTDTVMTTVYTFEGDGNVISEYVYSTETGNVGGNGEESGINPRCGEGAGVVSNINNLLTGHAFETTDSWTAMPANGETFSVTTTENGKLYGGKRLLMQSSDTECTENGVFQTTGTLPAGSYAFSAYVSTASFRGTTRGALLRVTDATGNVLGFSERLTSISTRHVRLVATFELSAEQSVNAQILMSGKGKVYIDAPQLENNPYANAYNLLENGNFERGTSGWTLSDGVVSETGTRFNMAKSLCIYGVVMADRFAYQQPAVITGRATRETFTLSGWAKGYGLPNHERDDVEEVPRFRLRAVIKYADADFKDYDTEEFTADFSPCTEEWQFASVQFSKSRFRTLEYVRVYCDYGYNSGDAYFDDIQLTRDSVETNLSASDFAAENLLSLSDDETEAVVDDIPVFSEARDAYGNTLTETTFTDGEFGTIYRSFGYNTDAWCLQGDDTGNNLTEETDARGNKTFYTVDSDTSRNAEVTDRLGNKTAYEYNASGRTTKVTNKNAEDETLASIAYTYDALDNLTGIVRGDGLKYALGYNKFHRLESISIDGKPEKLIRYAYKNDNGCLKQMTYANGNTMKATYNALGQMTEETWFATEAQAADPTATPVARYQYVYDGMGNIAKSIDMLNKKEYNYEYEDGKILRATESDINITDGIVTSRTVTNTIRYTYDSEDKLLSKVTQNRNGTTSSYSYESNEAEDAVVRFEAGPVSVTSHSRTDKLLRKVFEELETGTSFVSRQFSYHAGAVTNQHKAEAKLKSTATTTLVSQLVFSDERTISYQYDAEDHIVRITDSVDGVSEYTYNALNLLETETIGGTTTKFAYDAYGNLIAKGVVDENGEIAEATKISYTYDDPVWKDQLSAYNGTPIAYDTQGNPTSYLGHTLTWEKGRQLKSFDTHTYAYNANGIRVSKKVSGVVHTFFLEGEKIAFECWNSNVLIPMYDNDESVCGIVYNGVPYYFFRNIQNDVIEIADQRGITVGRYTYDAWGRCVSVIGDHEILNINPFRYRSYYFDTETGLYYLQSRYYDPVLGRFLNADDLRYLGNADRAEGFNLFSYCDNDPVNRADTNGHFWGADLLNDIKRAGEKVVKAVSNTVQKVVTAVKNEAKKVKTAIEETTRKTVNKITNATKKCGDTVKGIAKAAQDWTKNKIDDISKGVKSASAKVGEAFSTAWNWGTRRFTTTSPILGRFPSGYVRNTQGEQPAKGAFRLYAKDWVKEVFSKNWIEDACNQIDSFFKEGVWDSLVQNTQKNCNAWLMDSLSKLAPDKDHLITLVTHAQSNQNLLHNSKEIVTKTWATNKSPIYYQGSCSAYSNNPTEYNKRGRIYEEAIFLKCCNGKDLATVGCGLVAVYNIGVLSGHFWDMRSIIYWFERNDGFILNATLGVNPNTVQKFFECLNVPVTRFSDVASLEKSRKASGFYIVCQWNNATDITKGAHYYAVRESAGRLIPYNGAGNQNSALKARYSNFASMLSYKNGGSIICGYKIG